MDDIKCVILRSRHDKKPVEAPKEEPETAIAHIRLYFIRLGFVSIDDGSYTELWATDFDGDILSFTQSPKSGEIADAITISQENLGGRDVVELEHLHVYSKRVDIKLGFNN